MGMLISPYRHVTSTDGPTPTYEGNGGLVDNVNTSNPVDIPYPAGLAADDIAFLQAAMYDSTTVNSIDTPSGWNLVDHEFLDGEASLCHAVFWKRLTGSESGTQNITCSTPHQTTDTFYGVMSIWRGCVASGTPYEQLGNNTGQSTSMAGTSVTTSGPNRIVLNFCATWDDTLSTPATDWTEVYDLTTISGALDGASKIYSIERPTAGTYGAATHTLAASERWQVMSLALIPA